MKKIIALTVSGMLALLFSAACSIEAGVGGGDTGTCAPIACGDALTGGLASGDTVLCDAPADSAYQDLLSCGCAACDSVCGDNLCAYLAETPDCGDCLNTACAPEHDTCINN